MLTDDPTPQLVLSVSEASRATGLSRSTLYRLSERGDFVPRVQLSRRRFGYQLADIRQWLISRLAS